MTRLSSLARLVLKGARWALSMIRGMGGGKRHRAPRPRSWFARTPVVSSATAARRIARARTAMEQNGLTDWKLELDRGTRRAGTCNYTTRTLTLSRSLVWSALVKDDEVHNVALHEIAHAKAGPHAHHGPEWKRIALSIGCDGKRTHTLSFSFPTLVWYCAQQACAMSPRVVWFMSKRPRVMRVCRVCRTPLKIRSFRRPDDEQAYLQRWAKPEDEVAEPGDTSDSVVSDDLDDVPLAKRLADMNNR